MRNWGWKAPILARNLWQNFNSEHP